MQPIMFFGMSIAAVCIAYGIGCFFVKTIKWLDRKDEIKNTAIALQKAQDAYASVAKY